MNSQIIPVNLSELMLSLQNKVVGGMMENMPDALGNLKINDVLTLEFVQGMDFSSGSVQDVPVKVSLNGQTLELPLKLKLDLPLDLSRENNLRMEIKVTALQGQNASFSLTAVNGRRPEAFVRDMLNLIRPSASAQQTSAAAPIFNINISPHAALRSEQPANLPAVIARLSEEIAVSSPAVKEVVLLAENFPVRENVAEILTKLPPATRNAFEASLREMLANYAVSPSSQKPEEFLRSIVLLLGRQIVASPAAVEIRETMLPPLFQKLDIPLAEVETLPDIKIPSQTISADLTLDELLSARENVLPLSLSALQPGREKVPAAEKDTLFQILSLLRKDEKSFNLIRPLVNKIPNPESDRLLVNLVNYVKAARSGDLTQWLGKEISGSLRQQGAEGQEVSDRLSSFLTVNSRETAGWRMMEIPLLTGQTVSYIRMAVKRKGEDENAKNSHRRREAGTRFVVDTSFSALGKLQFDGMSFEKQRSFDLIIRTEKELPADVNDMIRGIFNKTLLEMKYIGTIEIKFKENFIKPWENNSEQSISRGILV